MPKFTDQRYLLTEQYRDATNLNARGALHERFNTNPYPIHRWLFDHLDIPADGRVLDLGCGTAGLWRGNRARLGAGWRITLADLSPGMLAAARWNLRDLPHPFHYAQVDAQALPFADASFDAVVANHMLYHVADRERAYAAIHRVLRPGGHLYASTNGRGHLRGIAELAQRFAPAATASGTGAELGFALENGGDELARRFAAVTFHRYEDALVVTEAAPLVAYMLTMARLSDLRSAPDAGDLPARLTDFVQREIDTHGAIHITKETGLFEATRRNNP